MVFDLDGTIVDTGKLWEGAFEKVLKDINADIVDYHSLPNGVDVAGKWAYILALEKDYIDSSHKPPELAKQTNKEFLNLLPQTTIDVRPGFWPFIYELKEEKKLKLALTTNTVKEVTDQVLNRLGIFEAFDAVFTLDDVKNPKPDPEIYKKAMKTFSAKPKEILVFEDSVAGTMAAVDSGADVVVIYSGAVPKNRYPLEVLFYTEDFSGLPGNLDTTLEEDIKAAAKEILQEKEQNPTEIA